MVFETNTCKRNIVRAIIIIMACPTSVNGNVRHVWVYGKNSDKSELNRNDKLCY